MISKNIKPKKIASIVSTFSRSYDSESFKSDFNRKILKKLLKLKDPKNVLYVFSELNSFAKEIEAIQLNNRLSKSLGLSFINPNIHTLDKQNVYLAAEVILSQESKSIFKATVDFYAVDEYSDYSQKEREIFIPHNSIVYQVGNGQSFKAYKKDDQYYFIRTSPDMKEVELSIIDGKNYVRKNKDDKTLIKIELINNSIDILNGVVKVEKLNASASGTDSYISSDGKQIRLKSKLFKDGEEIIIEDLDGLTKKVVFGSYNLSDMHKSLTGKVKSILVYGALYLSDKKL